MGYSCRTLLWDTLVGHSCRKLLWDTLVGHSCGTLLRDTLVGHSYETSSKTRMSKSVSHETSSKSPAETSIEAHTSRSPAKQIHDSIPSKRQPLTPQSQCDSDIHLYHNSQPPDSLRLPRNVTSVTPRNLTIPCACHESSRVHTSKAHKVLRLSRNVTSVTPRNLTIPCACHETHSKATQSTAPATKSDNIISCELQQNLHHTTRLE